MVRPNRKLSRCHEGNYYPRKPKQKLTNKKTWIQRLTKSKGKNGSLEISPEVIKRPPRTIQCYEQIFDSEKNDF